MELDGSQHYEETALDQDNARTQWLNNHSIYVLRFLNSDFWNHLSDVCEIIGEVVKDCSTQLVAFKFLSPVAQTLSLGEVKGHLPRR